MIGVRSEPWCLALFQFLHIASFGYVFPGQCREVDEDIQVLVAECLGLLGAIDPSRLYSYSNIKGKCWAIRNYYLILFYSCVDPLLLTSYFLLLTSELLSGMYITV